MARNDGVDRTVVRHVKLNQTQIRNAENHNERKKESYVNQDVVPERSPMNIHFKRPTASYQEMFSRLVEDGTISTRGLKADADTFGELIFDVNSAYFHNHGGYEFARRFFEEAYRAAVEIVGGEQYILSAVMHADERNRAMSEALGQDVYHYHLHVVYVPVVEKQILWTKRCKDPTLVGTVKDTVMQVSMSKKWASVPAIDPRTGEPMRTAASKPVLKKSYSQLQDDFHQHMLRSGYTDLERGERGSSEEHLTVTQFKVAQEETRLAMFQQSATLALAESEQASEEREKAVEKLHEAEQKARQEEARIHELAPKLKNIEKLAAEFSADPEKLLPESGTLESAKSYREKKAKPLLARIVKVLRGIYRAYLDLLDKYKRLEKSYESECNANKSLMDRIETLTAERAEMAEKAAGYETLCTELGHEYVDEHIRRAKVRRAAHRIQPVQKSYMDNIAI